MAGETQQDQLVAFLSKLTGETLSADAPMQLRSVQRAALASWSRKQAIPIQFALTNGGASFTIASLLGVAGPVSPAARPAPGPAVAAGVADGAVFGIGIDIEDVAALPDTHDYREHAFYQDQFTDAEIAHCIRQKDAKASFCGLWAAKEAVVKAGLADAPDGRLRGIEISRDTLGRPGYGSARLSISHTATTAVAVCIAMAAAPAAATPASAPVVVPPKAAPPRRFGFLRAGSAAAAAVLLATAWGTLS